MVAWSVNTDVLRSAILGDARVNGHAARATREASTPPLFKLLPPAPPSPPLPPLLRPSRNPPTTATAKPFPAKSFQKPKSPTMKKIEHQQYHTSLVYFVLQQLQASLQDPSPQPFCEKSGLSAQSLEVSLLGVQLTWSDPSPAPILHSPPPLPPPLLPR